ncbi:MAG: hypothetical protein JSR41_15675 [Proteobacteria bacterium]|nr:hypothetical protein [Pseudomonadota bacterium]
MELTRPTRQIVIEVIEGLLSGKYTRHAVVQWQRDVCERFDYYGPGTLLVPLKNEDGYWAFVAFARLLESTDEHGRPSTTPFIRDADMREWWVAMMRCGPRFEDGVVRRVRWPVPQAGNDHRPLLALSDKAASLFKAMGISPVRGIVDDLGELSEFAAVEWAGTSWFITRSCAPTPARAGLVHIDGDPSEGAEAVGAMLSRIGIEPELLEWVSELLPHEPWVLKRVDDNGNAFVVDEYANGVEALLWQSHFERKGHKLFYQAVRLE